MHIVKLIETENSCVLEKKICEETKNHLFSLVLCLIKVCLSEVIYRSVSIEMVLVYFSS